MTFRRLTINGVSEKNFDGQTAEGPKGERKGMVEFGNSCGELLRAGRDQRAPGQRVETGLWRGTFTSERRAPARAQPLATARSVIGRQTQW